MSANIEFKKYRTWNLEKWYRFIYKAETETDIENKCVDAKGEWEELGEWDWHIYSTDIIYNIDN